MTTFDKWWNDLQKHCKRLRHWLPHWRDLAERNGNKRPLRYFTLCARPMIDVFLLVQQGLLEFEPDSNSIKRIQFCELDQEQFVEIREMIAREDAGFFGKLEDVVLFEDDDFTAQFPTIESVSAKLEDEGLEDDAVDRLHMKRTHFNARASFPYDCINLDFCEYYYPEPPGMLRVNKTVERFLDWQRRPSDDSTYAPLTEFVLAVTCRYDPDFPIQARNRLTELVRDNCRTSPTYKLQLQETRRVTPEQWAEQNPQDLFFAGWPKDIARSASEHGWSMDVLDYVYYERVGDAGNPYLIACLIARFGKAQLENDDIDTAMFALDEENRELIGEIERDSVDGKQLLANLESVVAVRNEQARRKRRPELPSP